MKKFLLVGMLCLIAIPASAETITTKNNAFMSFTTDIMDNSGEKITGGQTLDVIEKRTYQSGIVTGVMYKVTYQGKTGWIYGHDVVGNNEFKYLTDAEYEKTLTSKIGQKPEQSEWDGSIDIVKKWIKENANDPDSIKYESWSKVSPLNNNSWFVAVKFRGKNAFGAYVLNEMRFEIRNGKIVKSYSVNH